MRVTLLFCDEIDDDSHHSIGHFIEIQIVVISSQGGISKATILGAVHAIRRVIVTNLYTSGSN